MLRAITFKDGRETIFRHGIGFVAAIVCVIPPALSQDQPSGSAEANEKIEIEWTESDTKLANHYIQLLQAKPEYGNVLGLLWDLYEKKGQTPLLLKYIGNAANADDAPPVTLTIYGHLLRKNGQLDDAREFYGKVLDAEPKNTAALLASAEIADQQARGAKALALYQRAMEVIPVDTEAGLKLRIRAADLFRERDQTEEAVAIWNSLLAAYPEDDSLRSQVVAFLLQAGETETAISVLRQLAAGENPKGRLNALIELNRLYEFINDFEGARKAVEEALAVVHFKNRQHNQLFARLVRLHERFDRLPELEVELKIEADRERPSEKAVFEMAEFYQLTASPIEEERRVKRLTELVPGNVDYRVRYAMICMENDRYGEAATVLDTLLGDNPQAPLRFKLLRCRVALNSKGRAAAESMLSEYIAEAKPTGDGRKKILEFARKHYLDGIVEEMLRDDLGGGGAQMKAAPIQLAQFLQERGRRDQAIEALEKYVESAAEGAKTDRARRLHEVSLGYREMDLFAKALAAIEEAIALTPNNAGFHLAKAEILMKQRNLDGALAAFGEVRNRTEGLDGKAKMDQRMFSLLRGIVEELTDDEKELQQLGTASGVIQSVEQYRRLAVAASRGRRDVEAPPPKKLANFYKDIIRQAEKNRTLETRYRAAWWAFKMQDTQECFAQLSKAKAESATPSAPVEKLLLEMAVQMERPTFQARHLQTLSEIDPENRDDYLQRWAEIRFQLGFEDDAIRVLKELAAKPDASLATLKTLATVYEELGSGQRQIDVWKNAYQRASLFEKRTIIKQLTTVLVSQRQPDEALKFQLDLIEEDNDPIQKRKLFDTQLTLAQRHFLLPWLRTQYEALTRAQPFDRFFPEALAKIYRAVGDEKRSFEAMKKAYYMSSQDRDLLIELGEMAAKSNDLKSAIYYRRQLIAQNEDDADPESWKTLIAMLEKDFRLTEADLVRSRLESKFGQDITFLESLVAEYRGTGQVDAEIRILEKLVDLRPWDTKNLLSLGVVKRERGDFEGALAAFENVLKNVSPAIRESLNDSRYGQFAFLPVTRSTLPALDAMSSGIEGFPFLNLELQDEMIEWLDESHPEFDRIPSQPELIHLRAIESIAQMIADVRAGDAARKSEWVNRWKNSPNATSTEKLWAFRYADAGKELHELLVAGLEGNLSSLDKVWLAYFWMLSGQKADLVEWVHQPEATQHNAIYPVVALFLIVADQTGAEQFPEDFDSYFEELSVSDDIAHLFFKRLRDRGDLEGAYRVGNVLAAHNLSNDGDFCYLVGDVAGALGLEQERIEWLERALGLMEARMINRLPTYYTSTVSELMAATESADEKVELVNEIRTWIEQNPSADRGVNMQARVFIEAIAGRNDQAITALDPLFEYTLQESLPTGNIDTDEIAERNRWTRLQGNFKFAAARLDLSLAQARTLNSVFEAARQIPVVTDEGQSGLEEYESERVAFFLENLVPLDRVAPVQMVAEGMNDRTGRMRLARTLDSRGFRRESMAIYKVDALKFTEDYSILRGFLDAAVAAGEPREALEVIEQFFTHEDAIPTGMNLDDIKRYHAEFLFQLRDVERLSQLSHLESNGGSFVAASQSPAVFSYQKALARAYLSTRNYDALLRLFKHIRLQRSASTSHLLVGAQLLNSRGDTEEALKWLREIAFDQSDPQVEKEALLEWASLVNDEKSLTDLMRKSGAYADSGLSISLASRLAEAGFSAKSQSALISQARAIDPGRSAARSQLLAAAIQATPKHNFNAIEITLRQLMDGLTSDSSETMTFLTLVKNHGTDEWKPVLEPFVNRLDSKIAVHLALGYLNGELLDVGFSESLSSQEFDQYLESLVLFGDDGKNAARTLIGSRQDFLVRPSFAGDATRQISFFAKIDDRNRLAEVHARLMEEVGSDRFNQRGQAPNFPIFGSRWHLARHFEGAGHSDFAQALFERYYKSIRRVSSDHAAFLEDYARFLIGKNDFKQAEKILRRGFSKSIQLSPGVLAEYVQQQAGAVDSTAIARDFYLSESQIIELEEFRRQLAELKKIPDTPDRL